MTDINEETGIIGRDLPNIYIDSIGVYDKKVELDVSYFQKQSSLKFSKNKSFQIFFKFFQITDKQIFQKIKNLPLIQLLNLKEQNSLNILDVTFDDKTTKQTVQTQGLVKKSRTVDFNTPSDIKNLYYLAVAYFYESDDKKLFETNKNATVKKTIEIILENDKTNNFRDQYIIPANNIIWHGDILSVGTDLYTVSKNPQKLIVKQVENKKIKDFRIPKFNINKERDVAQSPSLNTSFAKKNFENFVKKSPVLIKEKTSIIQNPNPISIPTNSILNTQQLTVPLKKSIKNDFDASISNQNIKKALTINFSINLRKILTDNFLNKIYINDSIFNYLKDYFFQKEVKLYKKFIPNKNKSINNLSQNQSSVLCSSEFSYTDSISNKKDEYFRNYTVKDKIDYFDNKNKYKYYVELTFENSCGKAILEEIVYLNEGLKTIREFNTLLSKSSKKAISENNFNILKEITNNFIKLYSMINNLSKSEKGQFETKIYNFISPNNINNTSIKVLQNMYSDLIKEYTKLYESITGTRNIISTGINQYNVKNNIVSIKKDISEGDIDSVKKHEIAIRYIDDISSGNITFDNFIQRISAEKSRYFKNNKNNLYSTEYMFSYLAPESYKLDSITYNLSLLESELDNRGFELFLNNSIVEMKQLSKSVTNKENIPKTLNKIDENQNLKIQLHKSTVSMLGNKYGLKIQQENFNNNSTEQSVNYEQFYKQTKTIDKIDKINKIIDFNKNFNTNIPSNNNFIPNHLIKAKQENLKLSNYRSLFDYRLLCQLEIEINNTWILLTKSSLLNYISTNNTNFIKCRMIEHKYEYNKNLKYDISSYAEKKLDTFFITYDKTSAESLIQSI